MKTEPMTRRVFIVLFCLVLFQPAARGQDRFEGVSRIVAVGDVHGGFSEFVSVLRSAGVLDEKVSWIGAKTHLVQTGDVVDRGPDSRQVLDLLMKLEKQARKSGGRVHALLGNHEAMNIYGDLRYVSPAEYEWYRNPDSSEQREGYWNRHVEERKAQGLQTDKEYKIQWEREHPLGWIEHRLAFSSTGVYGKWLRQRNALIQINDLLFLHGGIGPKYLTSTAAELNKRIRRELEDFSKLEGGVTMDSEGPLWYRGMANASGEQLSGHVDQVLKNYAVRRLVLGHTPTGGAVLPRFEGRVILIDVGLSKVYGGTPACLISENSKLYALHRGRQLELPMSQDGLIAYLKAAAALDPPPSPLQKLIQALSSGGELLSSQEP
jgi:Calcineurin-like phosphoesterase